MTEAEMRKSLLNKLMFVEKISYGELHKEFENHDLFNYHLRELVTKGFVEKVGSSYSLTTLGKQQVALMEENGQYQKQFKVGMFIHLLRQNGGVWQMLLFRRKKHPHFDYIGAVTGKLQWGTSVKDNVVRELAEELTIVPTNITIAGVHREVFHNEQGEAVGDGVFFIVYITEWAGTPIEKNIEGEYFWCNLDDILSLDKIFRRGFERGLPNVKRYLADPKNFTPFLVEDGEDKLGF